MRCAFAPLRGPGGARQCQVFQKQKVPVPLRRCSPAVPPGLKSQRGEGGPKALADGAGSECYGVTGLGCSKESRDKAS